MTSAEVLLTDIFFGKKDKLMMHEHPSASNHYFISQCIDQSLEVARSKRFYKTAVRNITELAELISQKRFWAPIVWREGRNIKANFEAAYYMALDVDEGLSMEVVRRQLRKLNYAAVLYPTQSHQKQKGPKPPCDRFRFAIPFVKPIPDLATFQFNMRRFIKSYGADVGCASGSLAFRPAQHGIEVIEGGRLAEWETPPPVKPKVSFYTGARQIPPWINAKLAFGVPAGNRHREIFSIAATLSKCGFSESETISYIINSTLREAEEDGGQRTARDGWRAGQS